jgi:poly(beta-D-mannuronate) C5 epimerase
LKNDFWVVFAFVILALALSAPLISQYIPFNVLPLSIQESKAIKHKTPPSEAKSVTKEDADNTGSSTAASPTSPASSCIAYNPTARTITVSCTSARLSDVFNQLHDDSILVKQSPGTWFLNANLVIAKGATFHIDSTDTKWLKISSKVTRSTDVAKLAPAYWIDVHGSLKIDSVKITSWDPTTNYYARTNGSRTGTDVFILGAPRPSIVVDNNATGTTDITNSEIAYLGYEQGKHRGGTGLSYYYGGDGSILRNDNIHHVYFGLYTFGVGLVCSSTHR